MITVVILFGGRSGEHEVSCRSAFSVYTHLDKEKYDPLLIGIDRDGSWYLQEADESSLYVVSNPERLVSIVPGSGLYLGKHRLPADFVFPVLHGTFGEDGTVQGLLDILNIPYAGAGVFASSAGMDKDVAKRLWINAGLSVIPYVTATRETADSAEVTAFIETCGFPLFIKPARSGSSVGVYRCDSGEMFEQCCEKAFRFDTKILVEQAVKGREVECSVVGNEHPVAFVPGEIDPSHDFYDYQAKYVDPDGAALVIPAALPGEVLDLVKHIAVQAYTVLQTEGMARVDFFVIDGKPVLNEINTIPGFTDISMFSKMCKAGGLSYSDLLGRLIDLGMSRHTRRNSLLYSYSGD